MSIQLKKAALITGASSGIGRATAIEFSKNGYFVYLMGRNKERLEETAIQCRFGASILSCDLKDFSALEKRIKEALSNPLTDIQILINNAGVFERHSTENGSDEIWNTQFQVNMLGPVRLTRLLLPHFIKNKKGSIVNISSTLGIKPAAEIGSYSAMKAALNCWTISLAQELGKFGIRANSVCPGIVDTPIHDFHKLSGEAKKASLDSMAGLQPLGRIGTPEEIAQSIYFLGSDLSSWTTGTLLIVDGGINIA